TDWQTHTAFEVSHFTAHIFSLERAMGFEPTTASLEGWNSTTELRPPFSSSVLSSSWFRLYTLAQHLPLACVIHVVGRQGFEPWKPMATDLQSAPFGHLGTCPKHRNMQRKK